VINVEAAWVDNAICLDILTSVKALGKPEIGSTDPTIPIDTNYTDGAMHVGKAGGGGDYDDAGDESHKGDDIPTSSRW
jgi:hypothetical protein